MTQNNQNLPATSDPVAGTNQLTDVLAQLAQIQSQIAH